MVTAILVIVTIIIVRIYIKKKKQKKKKSALRHLLENNSFQRFSHQKIVDQDFSDLETHSADEIDIKKNGGKGYKVFNAKIRKIGSRIAKR